MKFTSKWIRNIEELMEQVPKNFKVDFSALEEAAEGEDEKGKLSEETRAIYLLLCWLGEKLYNLIEEHKKTCSHSDETCEEFRRQASNLNEDARIVKSIFYASVREELGLNEYDFSNVGVRKDGVIVATPREEEPMIIKRVISIGIPRELQGESAGSPGYQRLSSQLMDFLSGRKAR